MDAVALQKALLQQQQAFQLQLQNILMLQQSGLNTALNLSSSGPLLSLELAKQRPTTRSPSPALKEETLDTENKMMQVVNTTQHNNLIHYCLQSFAKTEDLLKHPLMRESSFYPGPPGPLPPGLPHPPMSVPGPFPPFSPNPPRLQGYQRPQAQVREVQWPSE